jgi:hypothetical protein
MRFITKIPVDLIQKHLFVSWDLLGKTYTYQVLDNKSSILYSSNLLMQSQKPYLHYLEISMDKCIA